MSRTLSIGKVGPGPDFFWVRPFLYLYTPAATSACLSDARLRSLISARGASLRWAIRCYGWGYLGRFGSLWSRVAPWALAEKKSGVRPNGLGSDRRMGCERRDVGLARHRDALGALDHAADRPAPAREPRGRSRRWPCSCGRRARASRPACRRAFSRPWRHGASRRGPALGLWPGLLNGESIPGSAKPTQQAPVAGVCCRPW